MGIFAASKLVSFRPLFLLIICSTASVLWTMNAFAQVESDERPLNVSQDGIGFHKDSVFHLNLRFRLQNRFGYYERMDTEDRPGVEAVVRRLRLRLDGYVLHPRIGYYIQLSFSRADQDLLNGQVAQVIRDAMVYYTVNKKFYVGFGQSKLPGNRERVISSGNLQLPDRSVANQAFTLDRDFGFFLYYTPINLPNQVLRLKSALTSGEGRGQNITPYGLSYTGRVEWLPMGAFKNLGDYTEGDLEFESTPKLSIAYTYNLNDGTLRSGGQLGSVLPVPVDMTTQVADFMFKYNGWGVMGEWFHRRVSGFRYDGFNDLVINRIARGTGFNLQVSKILHRRHELVVRYAGVTPQKGFEAFQYQLRTRGLGYNLYLNKHRVKLQYYLGFDDRTHPRIVPALQHEYRNRLVSMIQAELGI
ncbi:MAG TPA: porin [Lacibacter sp.]|nr:porin [Lacibacter sp.]HMO89722.1 porin [Lacibacter sp.]HMP86873.1 porin [Lacibacter sp.]